MFPVTDLDEWVIVDTVTGTVLDAKSCVAVRSALIVIDESDASIITDAKAFGRELWVRTATP